MLLTTERNAMENRLHGNTLQRPNRRADDDDDNDDDDDDDRQLERRTRSLDEQKVVAAEAETEAETEAVNITNSITCRRWNQTVRLNNRPKSALMLLCLLVVVVTYHSSGKGYNVLISNPPPTLFSSDLFSSFPNLFVVIYR